MNKKMFTATVALGSLLFVGGTQAHADDTTTPLNMQTDTGISFFDTNKPNPGPFQKNLSLAYVPGSFDFGSNQVSSTTTTYAKSYSQANVTATNQYIAVSDDRDKKTNWVLTAQLAAFTDGATPKAKTLDNAELSFNTGTVQKYNMDVVASDNAKTPTPAISASNSLGTLDTAVAGLFTPTANVTLVAGGTQATPVLKYTSTQQISSTAVATQVSNVALKVLDHSDVANKSFTSTISWVLSADAETDSKAPATEG